jgi:S-adenosylmethionine:tRNA ribosyltransferase-isomerase
MSMLVSDFDFSLPDELVAQEPSPRASSRLLVMNRITGDLQPASVADLPGFLRPGDVLVVNNTRVFAARLLGRRVPSGGAVECLLLERHAAGVPDVGPGVETWMALMHPGQKLKPGAQVRFEGAAGALMAEVIDRHFQGRRTIRLWSESTRDITSRDITSLIDELGHVPLPPYIKRPDTPADRERYQTVFARERGSVAAPTAGLHFTTALLDELAARGVERVEITLHVGYGTFKPVKVDRVEDHSVDAEQYTIDRAAAERIKRARAERRRIVAVGTTTTRALEHAALCGDGTVRAGTASADLFISPGFTFQVIGGLMTNFHLPKSSLLMLVSAFAGRERVLAAYRTAVAERYRFYSYGDAMLIV